MTLVSAPAGLTIRTGEDADWPAMALLGATGFGSWRPQETNDMWRTLMPPDSVVLACDGRDVVGMALYLDLKLTVPGGAVVPMAGVSWVVVSPTHRRRGVLRAMFAELHGRMNACPVAGLEASEAGIYGRFGYGPATVVQHVIVDRREARFHAEVPDPGGVRVARPVEHRGQLEDIDERWRLRTPGGLHTPARMWEDVLADRESARRGGSPLFCLLHHDGFALYRVHGDGEKKTVEITKLAAVTPQAHIALWRVLLGMDLIESVGIQTHPDDVLPYLLTDHRLVRTTGVEDALWLRLLDIPTALEARGYAADLSLVLDVSDDAPAGGRYALDVRGGRARCVPTDAAADVHVSRSVLASLYMGAHRASAFTAANRLRCNDSDLAAQLGAAFATDIPAELGYGF